MSERPSSTELGPGARAEVQEALIHSVLPGQRPPEVRTHRQVESVLARGNYHIVSKDELSRITGVQPYDHVGAAGRQGERIDN